ncbi:MAG: transposase, partial [Paraprevotella clara]|nr:transposase [Paraprevotella clara]
IYKELERVIRSIGLGMSVDKVLCIAKTITTIRLRLPNGEAYMQTLFTTPQQEAIRPLLQALDIALND